MLAKLLTHQTIDHPSRKDPPQENLTRTKKKLDELKSDRLNNNTAWGFIFVDVNHIIHMNLNTRLNKYRSRLSEEVLDHGCDDDDDSLAPVMLAIDAVQQLIEQEGNHKQEATTKQEIITKQEPRTKQEVITKHEATNRQGPTTRQESAPRQEAITKQKPKLKSTPQTQPEPGTSRLNIDKPLNNNRLSVETFEDEDSPIISNNPFNNFTKPSDTQNQDEYEFIPKSVTLDVYSNDPEVKRFLKQLPRICNETGYNEQDYKCYSCRRPIGLIFGQSKLCHFDGHHYCSECHLDEKSVIPARILCNWDFNKYPVSKRNQHFLNLILNESMFELKKISPLLYKISPELREIETLRRQALFIRSYCTTCVQESISFELTKLIWPREHLFKQTDLYSLEDLVQIKSGALKQVLKNVITFGRQHVLSCLLCCQKGFICEFCKSSQIIYPFDTDSVHQCDDCQSIYHKSCFKTESSSEACPRCQRLKARRDN